MSKISTDCHTKACRSVKRRTILKISSVAFRKTYALSVSFKEKVFFSVKTNTNSNFARKLAERSNNSFLLSI